MDVTVVGQVVGILGLATFLALAVEKFIEIVVKPLASPVFRMAGFNDEQTGLAIQWLAFLIGTALSFGFGLDLFAPMAEAVGLVPAAWLTQLSTAFIVGGGSNLIHDLWPNGAIDAEIELEFDDEPNSAIGVSVRQ